MKKIISFFIILLTVTIVSLSTTMALFTDDKMEVNHNISKEDSNDSWESYCEDMKWNSEQTIHECCISPFSDSNINSKTYNTNSKKEAIKWKILDYSFLWILKSELYLNNVERLNSPPYINELANFTNSYIELTGSIKSNC